MQNLANVFMDGNLVADPEVKQLKSNRIVTAFRVAVSHDFNSSRDDRKFVSYFQVECWEKLAENCGRFLKKGDHVTLMGELRQDRWQDPDGRTHSIVKIVARYVRFDSLGRARGAKPDAGESMGDADSAHADESTRAEEAAA